MYLLSVLHVSFWCLRVPIPDSSWLELLDRFPPTFSSYPEFSESIQQNANGPSAEALLSFSDCVIILILPIAFGIIVYIALLLLKSSAYRNFTEHNLLEFTWTFLPAFFLVVLAIPSLSLLYLLDEVGIPTFTGKVQGHQWYWHYEFSDFEMASFDSYLTSGPLRLLNTDASLTVPPCQTLRLLITGADVLHSWAIPSWGVKADAVPGRLNIIRTYLERSGVYYGQCSEICGSNHSFIPIMASVLI